MLRYVVIKLFYLILIHKKCQSLQKKFSCLNLKLVSIIRFQNLSAVFARISKTFLFYSSLSPSPYTFRYKKKASWPSLWPGDKKDKQDKKKERKKKTRTRKKTSTFLGAEALCIVQQTHLLCFAIRIFFFSSSRPNFLGKIETVKTWGN